MLSPDTIGFSQMQLTAERIVAQSRLPRSVVASAMFEQHIVHDLDMMVMSLEALVYGKKQVAQPKDQTHTHVVAVQVPASWWQAFKLSAIGGGNPFFDAGKVRYETVERVVKTTAHIVHERQITWPELDLPVPEHWGRPIEIALPTRITWQVRDV